MSGIKKGAFSVTLNAVLSPDTPEIATPISFFLRDVLSSCQSYKEAKEKLEATTIASDCLLLLSGMNRSELAVIERTPTRFASRFATDGFVTVTNDYKKLENVGLSGGTLQETSCSRFDRASELILIQHPETTEACMHILQDTAVMMGITVQQMVFNNASGEIQLIAMN